jgi:hypothetical protein
MSFWQSLIGNIFGFYARGGRVATGDPPAGNRLAPYTTQTANPATGTMNLSWDAGGLTTVNATNNLYLEPGTNLTIQSGALGGDINIRTHYDQNNMDRVYAFGAATGGTADNAMIWNNGTTTATIANLRISEWDYRFQQGAGQTGQYIQGRINDHLNQHIDNQLAGQIQGQAEIFRPFGGGLQGAGIRHPEPPNLETPRAIAEVRGNNLLKGIIGDVLYHHYEKKGYVDLPSVQKPGVGFRLRAHRRIGLLKRNRLGQWIEQKESLCIHAAGGYWVEGDQVGIHYMLCQCDEVKLWKQAIVHRVAA